MHLVENTGKGATVKFFTKILIVCSLSLSGFLESAHANENPNDAARESFPAFSGEVSIKCLPLSTSQDRAPAYFSPEYAWGIKTTWGSLSGSGYADVGVIPIFITSTATYTPPLLPFLGTSIEGGWSEEYEEENSEEGVGHFIQVGPRLLLTHLPIPQHLIDSLFEELAVSYYERVDGKTAPFEILITWETRPMHWETWNLLSDGLVRFRESSEKHLAQPAFWVYHDSLPHCFFGTELEVLEKKTALRFGFKISYH